MNVHLHRMSYDGPGKVARLPEMPLCGRFGGGMLMAKINVYCDSESTAKEIVAELTSFAFEDLLPRAGNWFVDPKNPCRVRIHVKNRNAHDFIVFLYA